MLRIDEPGWVRIGMFDEVERRSLWLRISSTTVELCAGREGDDAYVCLAEPDPSYAALRDVMLTMRFARDSLIGAFAHKDRPWTMPVDLQRTIEAQRRCGMGEPHEHEDSTYLTEELCPLTKVSVR